MFHFNKYRRRRRPWGKGFFFLFFLAGAASLLGLIVMMLWNAILPPVTGVQPLSFWQALGLLLLSRILFGGFPGRRFGPPGSPKRHWRDKWKNMSEEERDRYRQAWRKRCRPGDKRGGEEA